MRSLRNSLASLTPDQKAAYIASLTLPEREHLFYDWEGAWARDDQLEPADSAWRIWMRMCGRGEGKTISKAQWIRKRVKRGVARRIMLAAPTSSVARDVMIEGESGILAIHPPHERPRYEPSKRRLTWPNGAIAIHYSSDEPDLVRGAQGDTLWAEEVSAWRYAEDFFDNLNMGLRLGPNPQAGLSLTPRPTPLVKRLVKAASGGDTTIRIIRAATFANKANLPEPFIKELLSRYEGTRLGRQELYGELLDDVPGALWTWDLIEPYRVSEKELPPRETWERVVVAIDPAVTYGEDSDETGMVAAVSVRHGDELHAYVIRDLSGRYPAQVWPRHAVRAYQALGADRVVAEVNNGGDLVESALRVVDSQVAIRKVHASRGKAKRAEPVVGLYEQGRVHHVGSLPKLEEQMTSYIPGDEERGNSPDRADALVYALTDLLVLRTEIAVV